MRHLSSSLFHRIFAGLCLLVIPLAAAAYDKEELEKRFKDANAKLDAGELQPAVEVYNDILEAEPEAGNVWVMRAIAKWKLKDLSGARADLAQAIKLHPDNIDAYRVRGQLRYQLKDFDGSLADFNAAISTLENVVEQIGMDDKEAARKLAVENAELYGMRAEVRKQRDESQEALRDLERAIELKPDYVAARFMRGQLLEADAREDEAEREYGEVIALNPKHADALNNRAWIRFHRGDFEAAMADGRAALEIAPKAAVAMRVVGYSQFAQADYAAAAKTLNEAFDADDTPDSAYALFVRHFALVRSGGADKRLATSWGRWQEKPWLQALAKFIVGQIDEDALETVAKETTDDGELAGRACEMHFYVGLARLQAGDKSTARLRFQSALNTDQKTFVEHALAQVELARMKK